MSLTSKVDLNEVQVPLNRWIQDRHPGGEDVEITDFSVPKATGMSTETITFTIRWTESGERREQRAVARIAPAGPGLFMDYNLDREADVLSTLSRSTNLPVPKVLFRESDPSFIGAPFFIMEWVDGRVPADDPPYTTGGWVLDLSQDERAQISENSLRTLSELHDVDIAELTLDALGNADATKVLDDQLAYWTKFFEWAGNGLPHPVITPALEWLAENRPEDVGPIGLSWGDARMGNMLFGANHGVAAILDWEMVGLGPRELDLAWWTYIVRHHTDGIGAPLPDGLLSPDESIARYEEISGHKVTNLRYFEVFAGVRLASLVLRAASLMIEAGYLPADAPMGVVNPATKILAEMIGVPAPDGEAAYYIGNR